MILSLMLKSLSMSSFSIYISSYGSSRITGSAFILNFFLTARIFDLLLWLNIASLSSYWRTFFVLYIVPIYLLSLLASSISLITWRRCKMASFFGLSITFSRWTLIIFLLYSDDNFLALYCSSFLVYFSKKIINWFHFI